MTEIETGDPSTAEQLLPLVCDELRKLAEDKLALAPPGPHFPPDGGAEASWNSHGHFFIAEAEGMRLRASVRHAEAFSFLKPIVK